MHSIVIGLTGPTGAGKSTVADALYDCGAKIIDCDRLAREIVEDPECIEQLKREFGSDIVDSRNRLDRHLVAERAFCTPETSQRLNDITHPLIRRRMCEQIESYRTLGAPYIVVDAALLFEGNADQYCDVTVAVTAEDSLRLARIMRRDGIAEPLARARMGVQKPNAFYSSRADYSFDGGGRIEDVPERVRKLLRQITGDRNEKKA